MTNAIFQFFIGNPYGYANCINSVSKYCKKYGIKHYVSTERAFPSYPIYLEKLQFLSLVNQDKEIDRLLYVDADILITPHAKNIFEEYPDFNGLYAYDENDHTDWMDRDKYIHTEDWPKNERNKKQYFNTGLMLYNADLLRNNSAIFDLNDIPKWDDIWYFPDQTLINYWMVKNKILFKSVDHSYNRMDLGNYDLKNERYNANFIHYAGPCKYGQGNKQETMINDYFNLYK